MIPDINLLPKMDQESDSSKLIYILMGVIAALILVVLLWLYFSARGDVADLTVKQTELTEQRDQLQQDLLAAQNAQAGSLEESYTFVQRVSYPVSPIIDETKGLLTEDTYLRSYAFSSESTTIAVDFETLNDISVYVKRLENSPYFSDVQLGNVSTFDIVGGLDAEREDSDQLDFSKMPRYSTNITLSIDERYLANGEAN